MSCCFANTACSFTFNITSKAMFMNQSVCNSPLKAKTNQQVTLIASCHQPARRSSGRSSDWPRASTDSGQLVEAALILDETLMLSLGASQIAGSSEIFILRESICHNFTCLWVLPQCKCLFLLAFLKSYCLWGWMLTGKRYLDFVVRCKSYLQAPNCSVSNRPPILTRNASVPVPSPAKQLRVSCAIFASKC